MSRGPDAATLLRRVLERDAEDRGCTLAVTGAAATRWASATFTGARHRLTLAAADDAALAAWLAGLGEADLPLRGHLVADIAVVAATRAAGRAALTIEALTVEA